jgi:hypothetical protein
MIYGRQLGVSALTVMMGGAPTLAPLPVPKPLPRRLTCGSAPFPVDALNRPARAELSTTGAARALRRYLRSFPVRELAPARHWRLLVSGPRLVVFGHGRAPNLVDVEFRRRRTSWIYDGSGTCSPRGMGGDIEASPWFVDSQSVEPNDPVVRLRVRELTCAGGQSPLGRFVSPLVHVGRHDVTLMIRIRRRPGVQACIGNPLTTVWVRLPVLPRGRSLRDAVSYPPPVRLRGRPRRGL